MNYTLTTREATIAADEFIARYRDVERMDALCGQCPSYGNSWGCPPHGFNPAIVSDGFKIVKLMGTTIEFDEATRAECTTPEMSRTVATQAMQEVWETILPELYELERQVPRSRCFTFRCHLCPEGCTRPEGKPCRHPELLRYSLEAVGFDVTAATRDLLGINLEWSKDGSLTKHITIVTALFCR